MNIDLQYRINKMIDETKATYLASKSLYKGKFIELVEEDYLLPNQVVMKRERIIKNHHKDAVIIVARTNTDKYLLVCQNRIDNMTTLELPSGFIENGETIFEAAKRGDLNRIGNVEDFEKYINSFGSKTAEGTYTDISIICPNWGVAGVNLSVGYFWEHSYMEHFYGSFWYDTYRKVVRMLDDKEGYKGWKYIPKKYEIKEKQDNGKRRNRES